MNDKIKKKIDEYIASHEIAHQLANKVIKDVDPTSEEELNEFLQHKINRQTLIKRLEERGVHAEEIYKTIDSQDKKTDVDCLVHRLKRANDLRKRNRLIATIGSAVAVLVVAISTSYFGSQTADSTIPTIETMKVETKEISSPTLVYDQSGEEIILQKNRNLSLNGNNIAKVYNDKLEYLSDRTDSVRYATLMMPKQMKFTVVLHDGSEVCLNAKSRLKYPSRFVGNQRVVELDGEAYFKVTKGKQPFKVIVQGVEVTVYGTEFNVAAYDHTKVVTTLVTGSVGVRYRNNHQSVEQYIKPNERITIETISGRKWIETGVNTERYKAWKENYFRYDEEPLEELLEGLSNWYGVEFIYSNEAIRNKTVSASLKNDMEIDTVLKLLELTSSVQFIKEGGKYVVK